MSRYTHPSRVALGDAQASRSGPRVAVVANSSWYVFNFRSNLIRTLQAKGCSVVTMGAPDAYSPRLADVADAHCDIPFSRTGTNPLREYAAVTALRKAFREHRIDTVLSFTPKGNVYAALALRGLRSRLILNISGLGRAFSSEGLLRLVVERLYRLTLAHADWVFFQNDEDHRYFVERRWVDKGKCSRLPGSGVDLVRFAPRNSGIAGRGAAGVRFLLIARMLWDKGIGDYIDAARIVRHQRPDTVFRLLGAVDQPSPTAVPQEALQAWQAEGCIEYLGTTDDVASCIADADCVVLPSSYREGVPRSLLEAAAMGKPIIATDSVGCRDTVDDGLTGYLCRPKDVAHLADRMLAMIALTQEQRLRMGRRGRHKMEQVFDERIVLDSYLQLLTSWATGEIPHGASGVGRRR